MKKNEFMPAVIADLQNELGRNVNCYIEDDEPQIVVFVYNRSFEDSPILPVIRLEIGALATWTHAAKKTITPYAAEQYGRLFKQPSTEILTVLPERTFWEKVHSEKNIKILKDDYEHMKNMIYGEKPDFDIILNAVKKLEDEINAL